MVTQRQFNVSIFFVKMKKKPKSSIITRLKKKDGSFTWNSKEFGASLLAILCKPIQGTILFKNRPSS